MTGRLGRIVLACACVIGVAACGSRDRTPDLININRGQTSPDEFAILPTKPIEVPEDLAALPAPTPGASNRVDPTPKQDAVAALGGNPDRLNRTGTVRGDGALVNATTRYGVDQTIREDLAASDLEFRRRNQGRLMERLFNVTVYYSAYEEQSLDKERELRRWRRNGVKTPAAPPEDAAR